jgi:hypothetical protein
MFCIYCNRETGRLLLRFGKEVAFVPLCDDDCCRQRMWSALQDALSRLGGTATLEQILKAAEIPFAEGRTYALREELPGVRD